MSVVTDIVILGSCIDARGKDYGDRPDGMARGILRLNDWLSECGRGPLEEISSHAGGGKRIQADIWAGAYNCFDTEGFLAEVVSCEWFLPRSITILIQEEQDESGFTAYRIDELDMGADQV